MRERVAEGRRDSAVDAQKPDREHHRVAEDMSAVGRELFLAIKDAALRGKSGRRPAHPLRHVPNQVGDDALRLRMAEAQVLQQLAIRHVDDQEPFVGSVHVGAKRRIGAAGEVADRQRVRVILERGVVAPAARAFGVPERIADQELLAAVAVGLLLSVGVALPASAAPAPPEPISPQPVSAGGIESTLRAALGSSFAGAWFEPGYLSRCAYRTDPEASFRRDHTGFRVVLRPRRAAK